MSSSHNCASLLSYVCLLETWRCQLPRFPPWITRWEHCLSEAFAPPCTIFPPMQLVQRSWPFYSQAVWYHDYAINKLLSTSVIEGPLHLAGCGKYICFPIILRRPYVELSLRSEFCGIIYDVLRLQPQWYMTMQVIWHAPTRFRLWRPLLLYGHELCKPRSTSAGYLVSSPLSQGLFF